MQETQSYTWQITDPILITQIKTATPKQRFASPAFRLFNFVWELNLFPNGDTNSNSGMVKIYLRTCGLSKKISSINTRIRYCFVEGDKSKAANAKITQDKPEAGSWKNGTMKTSDFQKWDQLTFKIEITLYNVFNTEQDDITNKYLKHEEKKTDSNELDAPKLDSFTWTITDPTLIKEMISAKPGKSFLSPIHRLFNFTWQLQVKPTGHHEQPGNVYLFLNLCGLSPKVDSV
eukprot:84469_1